MAEAAILLTKVCSKCSEAKPATIEFFHPNKGGAFGLRGQCRPCRKAVVRQSLGRPDTQRKRKEYRAAYTASGRAAAAASVWRKKNPESELESRRKWRDANREKVIAAEQARRDRNRERQREKQRRAHEAGKSRPEVVLRRRIRARLRQAIRSGKMGQGTFELLGYTADELKVHIERQFTRGMTWGRLMDGDIHIDHIIPVCSFDIRSPEDPLLKVCWGLPNLRPLWASDNRKKQGKVVTLL